MDEKLKNYREFVLKVDELCAHIGEKFKNSIACSPGCDSCCRHLTLFPVEAVALAAGLQDLSTPEKEILRSRLAEPHEHDGCPLLVNGHCLLYSVRPLICRTHGYPILSRDSGTPHIDFCPRNFQGVTSFPGGAVINLDQLNAALTAINALFLSPPRLPHLPATERISMAMALRQQLMHLD